MSLTGQMMKLMSLIGQSISKNVEKMSLEPLRYQEELLMSILRDNADTEFGRAHGFADINSIEEFQNRVPVAEYDDYAPFIERMVNGEENVLVSEHISHYNKTSGTLGLPKYIPLSEKQVSICGKYHALHANAVISKQIGYSWNNGKGINLAEGRAEVLESGATYGSASSVAVKGGPFKNISSKIYTSPIEAKQPESGVITRYMHARFALSERKVTYIVATFSSIIMEMFSYIEHNWEMLVRDIENGTIDDSVDLPDEVRASLMKKIKPDPRRAAELRAAFEAGFDTPWARRLWPKMQYMYSAGGANFAPYTEKLRKKVLGEDMPIFYFGVSASEGFFSTVYKMNDPQSILTPDGCFMEFLDTDDENAPYLTMDKLEVGKCYELVITNFGGLYRYRMHDVFKVTGMHNSTPLIEFMNRAGYAANIRGEKTSEAAVRNAVSLTEKEIGLDVVDFSIYPDPDGEAPTYVMFLELNVKPGELGEGFDKEKIRSCLQKNLIASNTGLAKHFGEGHLAPIRLIILQRETYMLYRDVMIMRGASASQLKPLHVVRNEFQRKFLFKLDMENELAGLK